MVTATDCNARLRETRTLERLAGGIPNSQWPAQSARLTEVESGVVLRHSRLREYRVRVAVHNRVVN
jgi:hypothetical protein